MPFRPVQTERLAQSVVQQIELLILRGLLRPGERLPPERDLAERMGVSRPSLREAIADLQGRDLEGMAAERAARHGSQTDLKVIEAVFARMQVAHDKRNPADEAALDAEFHLAIIEASHNIVMLHMMRAMFGLLKAGVFYNRSQLFRNRTTRDALLVQHRAILDAILARDPVAARAAAEAHMDYVATTLGDLQRAEHHEDIARLRYEHELERP